MTEAHYGDTAVLALHYQNDVLHPEGVIRVGIDANSPERDRLIATAEALLERARSREMPVVHVRVSYWPDGAAIIRIAPIFRTVAAQGAVQDGTWGAALDSSLSPLD